MWKEAYFAYPLTRALQSSWNHYSFVEDISVSVLTQTSKHEFVLLHKLVSIMYKILSDVDKASIILNHNFCRFDHRFLKQLLHTPFSNWTMNIQHRMLAHFKNSQRHKIWFDGGHLHRHDNTKWQVPSRMSIISCKNFVFYTISF